MVPLLILLLILLCFIGLSFLAARGAVSLKKSKPQPQEGRKRHTQILHDVLFGQNDD